MDFRARGLCCALHAGWRRESERAPPLREGRRSRPHIGVVMAARRARARLDRFTEVKPMSASIAWNRRRGRNAAEAALAIGMVVAVTGCAAAVGAAVAAGGLRQGLAGVQQRVANSRSLGAEAGTLPASLTSPLGGTYGAHQVLGSDTLVYYVRTASRPAAPIMDENGRVTGYVLAGIAATTLDTLEARLRDRAGDADRPDGNAIFFIEGTQPATPNA